MLFQPGYTYETKNIVKTFLGTMKADGFFEPVSETEYGGYIKVAGKKRPLHDCKLIDGKYYDYSFDVLGYTVTIHAHIEDDGEIVGNAIVAGKTPMPCPGGIVKRTEKATGSFFADYHWPNREQYNWK